jgi:hypothetical protein
MGVIQHPYSEHSPYSAVRRYTIAPKSMSEVIRGRRGVQRPRPGGGGYVLAAGRPGVASSAPMLGWRPRQRQRRATVRRAGLRRTGLRIRCQGAANQLVIMTWKTTRLSAVGCQHLVPSSNDLGNSNCRQPVASADIPQLRTCPHLANIRAEQIDTSHKVLRGTRRRLEALGGRKWACGPVWTGR